MIHRALINVAGPPEAGKTTLIERLLEMELAFAICVRAERVVGLRREMESAPKRHPELRRYREAGASGVALYRFPHPDAEAFYDSEVMSNSSEAVFIEGDGPVEHADLSIFVAPAPRPGESLLCRVVRQHTAEHQASIERYAAAFGSRESFASYLAKEDDPRRAQELCTEIPRLRKDRAVFDDIIDPSGGNRVPITAVVANLGNPKDAGLRKCFSRVRKTLRSVSS